jgi:hypothetical protein
MEILITLAMKFWQWSILIVLIIIVFIINLFDKNVNNVRKFDWFKYSDYPLMKPLRIATKGKGFFKMISMWLLGVRHWEIAKDFHYELNGEKFVIPAGFTFDGASIPKFLHTFLSPVGVLLIGGLIHDYAYKYETLLKSDKKNTMGVISQKTADQIFRDINIEINGFYLMNVLAYWSLRVGGFMAWNKHRKVNAKIK